MITPTLDEMTCFVELATKKLMKAASDLNDLWSKIKPHPSAQLFQIYDCYVAAYLIDNKVVPVVTHSLFFASLPLGGSHPYFRKEGQPATFLGGYEISASHDGFSRTEQAWFDIKDSFHSQQELVDALDLSLQETYDTYSQFEAAVQGFTKKEKVFIAANLVKERKIDPRCNLEEYLPFDKGPDARLPYVLPSLKGIERYELRR